MRKLEWIAGLAAAALLMVAPYAAAQDRPIGKEPAKQQPAKKAAAQPKQQPKQQPVAKQQPQQPAAKQQPVKKALAPTAQQPGQAAAPAQAAPAQAAAAKAAVPAQAAAPAQADGTAQPSAEPIDVEGVEEAPSNTADDSSRWSGEDLTKSLAAYGQWLEDPSYGQVWIPDPKQAGEGFTPYVTGGRWSVNDGTWKWVSDLPWGNSTFHYGNWTWLKDRASWAWVPGRKFAPAWVVWRLGEPGYDYVGWAPMPPEQAKSDEPPGAVSQTSLPFWFVPTRKLFSRSLDSHVVSDRALGEQLLDHSRIFDGNRADGISNGFVPASPSLKDARIRAIRRVTMHGSTAAPQQRQFATPPARKQYRCHLLSTRPRAWRCGYE